MEEIIGPIILFAIAAAAIGYNIGGSKPDIWYLEREIKKNKLKGDLIKSEIRLEKIKKKWKN